MCEIKSGSKRLCKSKQVAVKMICKTSGKPITITNEHGMFCEDLCDMDKSIAAEEPLRELVDIMASFCDPDRTPVSDAFNQMESIFKKMSK